MGTAYRYGPVTGHITVPPDGAGRNDAEGRFDEGRKDTTMGNAEFTAHVNYAASLICNQQKQDADHGDSVEDALENLMKAEAEYYLKDSREV